MRSCVYRQILNTFNSHGLIEALTESDKQPRNKTIEPLSMTDVLKRVRAAAVRCMQDMRETAAAERPRVPAECHRENT